MKRQAENFHVVVGMTRTTTGQGQEWKKGSVIKSHGYRSYAVEVDGKVLRRNRVHLKQEKQITPTITEHKSKAKTQVSAQQNTKVKPSRQMTPKIMEPAKCATKMELITAKLDA